LQFQSCLREPPKERQNTDLPNSLVFLVIWKMMRVENVKAVNSPELLQKKYPDQESCIAGCMKEGMTKDEATKACAHLKNKQGIHFAYQATFEPYEEQGKHLAKIHIIDLATNANDWQVTATA
jgi:hypothetical protein